MSPCRTCESKCCRYFALQIDTPRSRDDFENIRWYIAHKGVMIYVKNRKWYMDISNKCRFLTKDFKCSIYDKRPLMCREHSPKECERTAGDFGFSHVFHTLKDLDKYIEDRFSRKKKCSKKPTQR